MVVVGSRGDGAARRGERQRLIGVTLLALFLVTFLLVLSWADYSYVQPASAAGYALVPLLAYAIAGENVSALRWGGVALISVGVLLIGRTPVRTSGQG